MNTLEAWNHVWKLFTIKYCNLATASKGAVSELSVMYFVADPDGTLYFRTNTAYRKTKNLQENPCASVTIYDHPRYLQCDGVVQFLSFDQSKYPQKLFQDKYGSTKYEHVDNEYFSFKPTWIKFRYFKEFPATEVLLKG